MEKVLMLSGKNIIDEESKVVTEREVIRGFLTRNVGQKNLLVIRVTDDQEEILNEIREFAKESRRELISLQGDALDATAIRALKEKRDQRVLITVENLSAVKDLEALEEAAVFRAIIDMSDPGNVESCLHEDSSFVFLAEEGFPSQEMATISLTWAYETAFLDCRDFRMKVLSHMKSYKERFLRLKEEVILSGRSYGHILPDKYYEQNFSRQVSDKLISSKYLSTIHWHRFSHHLNSSQVMAVNFLYPLIRARELDTLLGLAGIEDQVVYDPEHLSFSKTSDLEETDGRRTCFDFHMKLLSGKQVFVDVKYTDGCYGRAMDPRFKEKYHELYQPLLVESPVIREEFRNEEFFLKNYYTMRSVIHMNEDSTLLVIYPRENRQIRETALRFRDEVIEPRFRHNFIPVVWEDLLEVLPENLRDDTVARYYETWFKDKYFRY